MRYIVQKCDESELFEEIKDVLLDAVTRADKSTLSERSYAYLPTEIFDLFSKYSPTKSKGW